MNANKVVPATVIFLVGLAAIFVVCRTQFETGFSFVLGDRYDGFIATAIIEHWYNVARNLSPWNSTFYFFPAVDTLGYNDAFLAHGLLGAVLRFFGFDVFIAAEIASTAIKALGYVAFFWMLRICFEFPIGWSILGAALFTVSNNLFLAMVHVQFVAFSFAPLVIVIGSLAVRNVQEQQTARGIWIAAGATIIYGIWLLTGFYSVWYFSFFVVVVTVMYALVGGWRKLVAFGNGLLAKPVALSLFVLWTTACILPFLWVYLPKAQETGMHPFAEVAASALEPIDIVNVSSQNVVWGHLIAILYQALYDTPLTSFDRSTGFPPILFIVALIGSIIFLIRRPNSEGDRVLQAISLAVLLTWPFSFRFGQWTPWQLIYSYIPGAGAIRVIGRYQLFLTIPAVVLAIALLVKLRLTPVLATILGFGLLAEETNKFVPTGIDRLQELALLNQTPNPPLTCKAFFVSNAREGSKLGRDIHGIYSHNVDAMLIAEVMGVPTINGFSSFVPPGWDFAYPNSPDYLDRVSAYAEHYRVQGLCALDVMKRQWERDPNLNSTHAKNLFRPS